MTQLRRTKTSLQLQAVIAGIMATILAGSLYAQTITPVGTISTSWFDRLMEPQNIMSVLLVVFYLGGLYSQIGDLRKRVSDLERWRTEDLDGVYARKETVNEQLRRRSGDRDWNQRQGPAPR